MDGSKNDNESEEKSFRTFQFVALCHLSCATLSRNESFWCIATASLLRIHHTIMIIIVTELQYYYSEATKMMRLTLIFLVFHDKCDHFECESAESNGVSTSMWNISTQNWSRMLVNMFTSQPYMPPINIVCFEAAMVEEYSEE